MSALLESHPYPPFFGVSLLLLSLQVPATSINLHCTLNTKRSECSALPVIHRATLDLTNSKFKLHARYEACHSIRTVHIKGRVLETVITDNIREYELLGESYEPVTDFIPFPRTIAYLALETSSDKGSFIDVWSAQRLSRHPLPSLLTVPITCRKYKKEH